jgi:hypothetical protein
MTMTFIALFFAGAFLCNSVPHLIAGVSGMPFPSPFATPHGVGDSPPLVNFWWGAANLLVGLYLLQRHPVPVELSVDFITFLAGVLALGTFASLHFGKVRSAKARQSSS